MASPVGIPVQAVNASTDNTAESQSVTSSTLSPLPSPDDQAIIGTDNRIHIAGTTAWPYRAIVYIRAYFPKLAAGFYVQGTGTLVAADTVLTAGHVLYEAQYGGYADRVTVTPAYSQGTAPYGTATGVRLYTAPGYTAAPASGSDFGVIKLNSPLGTKTGWMGLGVGVTVGEWLTLSGYSGDLNGTLDTMAGPVSAIDGTLGLYAMDSAPGASGSPVYDAAAKVHIVHAFGSPTANGGIIITPERSSLILGWRNAWTPLQTMSRLVYVVANNSLRYSNTVFTASGKNTINAVYQVRRTYLGWNGQTYYTVYNAKGQYLGYSNVGNFRTVTASNVKRSMTVRSRTALRYSSLYLTATKGTTAAYYGRQVYVTTKNVNGVNGRAYYSIYTKKGGSWLGYVSASALR